ncbi:phosphotransferase [Flavobacterium sp. Sd200]|uniref:phosphotransferase n=1 Tax=Flavobacterium sp. Sd200 TaxID=2692211 RepID=UPI00351B3912
MLRVYSHNWRSKAEVEEEIRLLTLLKDNGISISYPVADINGNYIQEINAPEGMRYAVVFSYAEGGKVRFIDPDTCAKIGAIMAQMHNVNEHTAIKRINYNDTTLLELPYRYAQQFFSDDLPEMQFVKTLSNDITGAFANTDANAIKTGIVHLDIWYDNMSITENSEVTIFDFDFCGNGPFILDVAYFCKQLFHIETNKEEYELKKDAFLAGYQSIRKLTKQEIDLIPLAGAAVYIFYLGVQCRRFDWSNIFLTENYLKMYVGRIKNWVEYNDQ